MELVPLILAYLLPLGLILVAWGAWDTERVRDNAVTALLVIAIVIMSYAVIGFALQFGGIGLRPDVPAGLHGLDRMWSPVSSTTGSWGVVGLEGFMLQVESSLPGDTALVFTLFLHHLPIVISASLLPGLALAGRARCGHYRLHHFSHRGLHHSVGGSVGVGRRLADDTWAPMRNWVMA